MNKILIVAKNMSQAHAYCTLNKIKRKDFIHINDPNQLFGLRDEELLFVGEYYKNPRFHEIEENAKCRGFKIKFVNCVTSEVKNEI